MCVCVYVSIFLFNCKNILNCHIVSFNMFLRLLITGFSMLGITIFIYSFYFILYFAHKNYTKEEN